MKLAAVFASLTKWITEAAEQSREDAQKLYRFRQIAREIHSPNRTINDALESLKHSESFADISYQLSKYVTSNYELYRKLMIMFTAHGLDDIINPNMLSIAARHNIRLRYSMLGESDPRNELSKWEVIYDVYGANKQVPLKTGASRVIYADSEDQAIKTLKKLVGGTNHKAKLLRGPLAEAQQSAE